MKSPLADLDLLSKASLPEFSSPFPGTAAARNANPPPAPPSEAEIEDMFQDHLAQLEPNAAFQAPLPEFSTPFPGTAAARTAIPPVPAHSEAGSGDIFLDQAAHLAAADASQTPLPEFSSPFPGTAAAKRASPPAASHFEAELEDMFQDQIAQLEPDAASQTPLPEFSSPFPGTAAARKAQASAAAYSLRLPRDLFDPWPRFLLRHRISVLGLSLAGGAVGLLVGLGAQPVYRTHTSLEIRSLNSGFVNLYSVAPARDNSADADADFQTQLKLLESESLLQQTAEKLVAESHPGSIPHTDLLSQIFRSVGFGGRKPIPYTTVVANAMNNVTVQPINPTRLVEITCNSYDPQLSASFCNTLVRTFSEHGLESHSEDTRRAGAWLAQQVIEVRQRVEDDQARLDRAAGGNALLLSPATTSLGEDRLHSLQDELVKAEADRIQREADANLVRTAPGQTQPASKESSEHRAYQLKLAKLQNQLEQLGPAIPEVDPRIVRVRVQIQQAEVGLLATQTPETRRSDNEYLAAIHREHLLNAAYSTQESRVSTDLQKAAQVSLLRKQLDSEQNLYQALLERSREVGLASAIQATTTRVVDAARVPDRAFSPRRKLASGIGLALGALFGAGLAFFRDNQFFRSYD